MNKIISKHFYSENVAEIVVEAPLIARSRKAGHFVMQSGAYTGIFPTVTFDGDQSDPRCFSEAQYETRVEALVEIMAENKRKKEAAANV